MPACFALNSKESTPEACQLALPPALLPRDSEQDNTPRAGAVLAEREGRAGYDIRLHALCLAVPNLLGGQAAGHLPLQQGLTPDRLVPLARLYQPYLREHDSL